jgi:hypothetical protein
MPKIEIEQTELEQLKARVAELEKAGKPPEPIKSAPYQPPDYTRGATMDAETMREWSRAISPELARDLRDDALNRPNPVTGATPAQLTRSGVQIQRGDGWAKERKIEPPPGVPIMDRLMDMQDKIDKADLQRRLAQAGATAKEK